MHLIMAGKSNQELIVAGLYKMAWSFPFIFIGPALFIGKGTTGAWYWTVLSLAIMATGVFLAVWGLRTVLKGFFGD
jgi:hypothetical protein